MTAGSLNVTAVSQTTQKSWCGDKCTELNIVFVMLGLFSTVGTIGNSLVIYVFGKRKEKLTSTMFILALAITDFITSLFIMPFTIYSERVLYKYPYDMICKIYNFCITFGVPCSCFIMVAIAVDRYFCICHPFAHAITVKRAQVMIIGIVSFACLLGIITSLTVGVYEEVTHVVNCTILKDTQRNYSTTDMITNITGDSTCKGENITTIVYTGQCKANQLILSTEFKTTYQKIYSSLYILSVVIVMILYCLIYRSVRGRRAMRLRMRGGPKNALIQQQAPEMSYGETQMTVLNGHEDDGDKVETTRERKRQNRSCRDKNNMANLKTAFMLFVVTAVFVIAFAPAWLMTQKFFDYNLVVFYMYFVYNVSNPVIYAFLNQSFRDDLSHIFRCKSR